MRKSKKSNIPLEVYCEDGETITEDHQDVLNRWARDFGSLLTPPEKSDEGKIFVEEIKKANAEMENLMTNSPVQVFNRNITDEVKKVIKKSKNNKAPGLDSITYEVLKNDISAEALTGLFNRCLMEGMIPHTWVRGIINPIPKSASSDPRVPLNYRGISLLPVISKLFTALIASRVTDFLEANNILANEQNGFRPNRSCLDHIFTLCDLLRTRGAGKQDTFCSFVDFQKAFDYVDHNFLLHKLLLNGIDGCVYNIVKAIYSAPESCVLVNDRMTDWFPVKSGVRQGDSLSPILFALFINDLASDLNKARLGVDIGDDKKLAILMYADDVVIISGNHADAQKQLDIMT